MTLFPMTGWLITISHQGYFLATMQVYGKLFTASSLISKILRDYTTYQTNYGLLT